MAWPRSPGRRCSTSVGHAVGVDQAKRWDDIEGREDLVIEADSRSGNVHEGKPDDDQTHDTPARDRRRAADGSLGDSFLHIAGGSGPPRRACPLGSLAQAGVIHRSRPAACVVGSLLLSSSCPDSGRRGRRRSRPVDWRRANALTTQPHPGRVPARPRDRRLRDRRPSPPASSAPTSSLVAPLGGQTETEWGLIWDELPADFPVYPGAVAGRGVARRSRVREPSWSTVTWPSAVATLVRGGAGR